ncbi:glycerol dehydrogenase [Salinarimonas rosea]|uniref:glycerol dehydrogenase n=1 Tax=Salinarimonas rosea TaxID=552063 RepID=UPI0003F68A9D|nr:glycerol dehydrogenase [Salinarimonas rosea]
MSYRIFGAPQRYVQGPGAAAELGAEVARLGGGPVAVVIDPVARDLLAETIARVLPGAALLPFGGECTAAEIDARAADVGDAQIILGIGGGKAIDTAKGAAILTGRPVGIVPTIASNDSPTSHIAVVYTPDHAVAGVRHMATNPAFVVVDTAVVAGAPRRFLAAGIGDAMSKPFELAGALAGGGRNFFGGTPTELTRAIVGRAHDILRTDGEAAMAASAGDPAFERVVEAAILLSGLAFESGGLSIAHSMVRGFSADPRLATLLHGEMVALGTLVQLAAGQGTRDEILDLAGFFRRIGLPTSLAAFGLVDEADLLKIAEISLTAPYASNYERSLSAADLVRAMRALDDEALLP